MFPWCFSIAGSSGWYIKVDSNLCCSFMIGKATLDLDIGTQMGPFTQDDSVFTKITHNLLYY